MSPFLKAEPTRRQLYHFPLKLWHVSTQLKHHIPDGNINIQCYENLKSQSLTADWKQGLYIFIYLFYK